MRRYGGAAIRMQQGFNKTLTEKEAVLDRLSYLVGSKDTLCGICGATPKRPFDGTVTDFLNDVSKALMADQEARAFSDVVTFAFWIRKSATAKLKEQFDKNDTNIHLGRGVAFHIAPSNVPVNYAYSLAVGLLTGNANVVRIPSKDFPQVRIINKAIHDTLSLEAHAGIKDYICLVRYDRNREVNDLLSGISDTRIIWGGNATIKELRRSPLKPRASEITFADRFSIAVIDSDCYLERKDKLKIAEDFYNDTYLTDQNACTSPRMVVWMGTQTARAKETFWKNLHVLVQKKYAFQAIQGVNKLTSGYLLAAAYEGVKIEPGPDNLIVRVRIPEIFEALMEFKDNSGYFLEYDCNDVLALKNLCDDMRCQTVAYIGDRKMLTPLLESGVKGIDRIVPVGQAMDFGFIWDGYDLYERLTRTVSIL